MKKIIIYSLALASAFFAVSCDKFLDTSSPSEYTSDVVYSTPSYADFAVMGCYALLTQDYIYSARLNLNYVTNSDIEFVGADAGSYNNSSNRGLSNYMGNSGNTTLAREWTTLYKLIERCNLVIEGTLGSPVLQGGDNDAIKKMYAVCGEALALRSLAYFELVRNWGDIPFKTESTKADLSNVYIAPTDRDDIMEQLITDLKTAEGYLPWVGSGGYNSVERITKGFVKGLTARIALARGGYSLRNKSGFPTERGSDWQKYYKIANEECHDIMVSDVHKLNDSYVDIWKKMCNLELDDTYRENLFEAALGLSRSGEVGYSIGVRFYSNTKYGYGNNANVVNTSLYYYYSFDKSDLRKDISVAYYQYGDGSGTIKEIAKKNTLDFNIGKWDQRWMSNQFSALNKEAKAKFGYGINWSIMRYSDVLLMFAETENALNGGPTDEAKKALKQVRNRAFSDISRSAKVDAYVDGLSTEDAFFNAIVNERAWEFGGEGLRKYDLIRWNLLMSKIEDQRTAFNKMFNKDFPVTIFDKTYDFIPSYVYYKYESNNEIIDKSSYNFYEDRGTDKISGYEQINWLWGMKDEDKVSYTERVKLFSSGLKKEVNGTCDNRHLYPFNVNTVNDANGTLKNSYGF